MRSRIKITGGELRSRKVSSPKGPNVRPTPGRVKEALFSIIAPRLEGARFLDLYSGTGAIGFEAASRGAKSVTCVEGHRETAQAIEESVETLGIGRKVTVVAAPVDRALYRLEGPFDLIFADPPYADEIPMRMFELLRERKIPAEDALIILEHSARTILPEIPGYRCAREEVYGDVALAFFEVVPG
ncbi:MAG: 16S rRNA (guanine(966)-N(2))-methyltransferase RsmD [Candidatus Eremiobacteraeota bacterium]|nr:16S rRNA (guanine(966)-N(2))-methyltransferase RsmD [Candidatus Eremiobacteraeota bacterium]MBV9277948.1 16S rRNA (guanine(966)-N(2))-methyltransferase RsmD [Candidatus Eremiobacteraeota bacterium]